MIMNFKNIFTTLLLMLTGISMNAQPTAQEWNKDVVGWNLGNQLECSAPGQDGESMAIGMADNSIKVETAWGNPVVTKRTIKAVKDAGFNAIRIPVRWQSHITNPQTMTIDKAWLNRVKEIVGWCLDNDLKVIINTHHDKWLEGRPTYEYQEENNGRLALLWLNIANELAQLDYRVAFAGTNEVHVRDNWGKPYKQYGETPEQDEQAMVDFFDKVADTWSAKGLGVVIGEWGVTDHTTDGQADRQHENATYYCRFLVSEARKRGFSTFVWDNNQFGNGQEKFGIFDRDNDMKVKAPWILKGIID